MFRDSYKTVLEANPVKTLAICILPNHLHCLWQMPESDADYSQRWRLIKGGFTRRLKKAGFIHPKEKVWQNRYWEHHIRDDKDFNNHIDYIHANPAAHGYVDKLADWPYSSWHKLDAEIQAELMVNAKWSKMRFGES